MRKGKKLIALVLSAIILSNHLLLPLIVHANLVPENSCMTYVSKDAPDLSGEKLTVNINNEEKTLRIHATTRNENPYYKIYIHFNGKWAITPQQGSLNEGHSFDAVLDVSDLYQHEGRYLLRINCGKDEESVTGPPYTYTTIPIRNHNGRLSIERYTAVEEKNKKIRLNGAKVLPENYLDIYMTDAYETNYGKDLNASKVKAVTEFAKSLAKQNNAVTHYDKAIAFHDFLGHNFTYDWDGQGNGTAELNPYNLLQRYRQGKNTKTICNGYAAFFVMLCRCVGIPARTVKGKSISLEKESFSDYKNVNMEYDHIWSEAYVDTDGDGKKEWTVFDCDGDSITRGWSYSYMNPSNQALSVSRLYLGYRETDATYMKPEITKIQSVKNGIALSVNSGVVKHKGRTLTKAQKNNVKAYVIYRGTSSSNLKKIKTVKTTKNKITFIDTTAKKNVKYYYKVAAVAKTDGMEGRPGFYRTMIRK